MELISVVVVIVASLWAILYGFFKYSFEYFKTRNIPYEEPSFPYGNINILRKSVNHGEFFRRFYTKFKPNGAKVCGVYFFFKPMIVLLDKDLIKSVMIKDFSNFVDRGSFYFNEDDDPLSAHLFSLTGDKWRTLRTKLSSTFTSGKMKFMFPTVVEVGERFRDCLTEIVQQNTELEIKELLARFTTDVIGTCAFGIECNSLKDPDAEFRYYGRKAFSKARHSNLIGRLLDEFGDIGRKLHIKWLPDDITEFFMKVVRDTVEYREQNNINRNDFMDLLIKLKNSNKTDKENAISFNELAAQCFIFFLAGFETSSTTLTLCLYELALNTEIQSKARRIIQDAFRKHDGHFAYEMMMDLPYIDQLLEETLRKYPPLATLNRQAKQDYPIPETDIVIEKGTPLVIPAFAIHHDPEYYPNPENFDPDRFAPVAKNMRDSSTWLSFGEGPRNCIGLRFGMMQARIGLVTLLNNFEFSISSKTTVPLVFEPRPFILSPQGGVYLKLKLICEK